MINPKKEAFGVLAKIAPGLMEAIILKSLIRHLKSAIGLMLRTRELT
jgi:hypothetical protein